MNELKSSKKLKVKTVLSVIRWGSAISGLVSMIVFIFGWCNSMVREYETTLQPVMTEAEENSMAIIAVFIILSSLVVFLSTLLYELATD